MADNRLSLQTLRRLPRYLNYLRSLSEETLYVSAIQIAGAIGLGEVQVRKDFAAVSRCGKPKVGYDIQQLMIDIEGLLAGDSVVRFCIAGADSTGMALAKDPSLAGFGLQLAALFDADADVIGRRIGEFDVQPIERIKNVCESDNIQAAVIVSSPEHAQRICDVLIDAGVTIIWNFAPLHLKVPDGVYVEHANLAAQLNIVCRRSLRMLKGH